MVRLRGDANERLCQSIISNFGKDHI